MPDGLEVPLHPGDVVGRSHAAPVRIDDPRVSEAHAMGSLRGGQLKLLALRGRLAVGSTPLTEVLLESGLEVRLARGVSVGVSRVDVPDHVLAIEGAGLPRHRLDLQSASLLLEPVLTLRPGYVDGAAATLWSDGLGMRIRIGDGPAEPLTEGTEVQIGPHRLGIVAVSIDRVASPSTRLQGRLHSPLRVVVSFDTAAIHREGQPPVGLGGMSARILSELVTLDGPAPWATIAGELWRDVSDEVPLRRRWDRGLARLRCKLRDAGIRPDLIRSDGSGNCELFLYEGDVTEDRT